MTRQRLALALDQMGPGAWERFEEFASVFLTAEFPTLVTTAGRSGDRGRDAELRRFPGDPKVLLQYSTAKDWATKIRATAARVREEHPHCQMLVYVTNQDIGSQGDKLRQTIRDDHTLFLEIRDRGYFLDRFAGHPAREAESERLAAEYADPYLNSQGVYQKKALALDDSESRAAFIHLALQWEDSNKERGLTKLCYEALIRSVLRATSPDNRIARDDIVRSVQSLLPANEANRVAEHVEAALTRMEKRFVRHYKESDEFCLTYEERRRIAGRLADIDDEDRALTSFLTATIGRESDEPLDIDELRLLSKCAQRVIERLLLRKGERFVSQVTRGETAPLEPHEVSDAVVEELATTELDVSCSNAPALIGYAVEQLISAAGSEAYRYMRGLGDTYTLFAFLRETPNVQTALKKLFAHGRVWLDANVLFPVITESVLDARPMTTLLSAAHEAGLELRVTRGVINEIEHQTFRALTYARKGLGNWKGPPPVLVRAFMATGRSISEVPDWISLFRGDRRPEDDLADYLEQQHSIVEENLGEAASKASPEMQDAVKEAWRQIHEERRARGSDAVAVDVGDLVDHDVENYLGTIVLRNEEDSHDLGYGHWWLTLDRKAFAVHAMLRERLPRGSRVPPPPLMDPDFFAHYLSLGPLRAQVNAESQRALPLPLDIGAMELIDDELLSRAEETRSTVMGQPDYLVRRLVRDTIDEARREARRAGGKGAWRRVFAEDWT